MICEACGQPLQNPWGVKLDTLHNRLSVDGFATQFTARETDILSVLCDNFGRTVRYLDIVTAVWPREDIQPNTLKVHLSAIRRKLVDGPIVLVTTWGEGVQLRRET